MIVQREEVVYLSCVCGRVWPSFVFFSAECGFYFETLHEPVMAVLSFTGTGRWWLRILTAYAVFIYNGRLFRIVLF